MKVRMKSTKRWCIDYKTKNLEQGETYELPDHVGAKIIEKGYGEDPQNMSKIEQKTETKQAFVPENKAIESTQENKSLKEPKKRGPKPKK